MSIELNSAWQDVTTLVGMIAGATYFGQAIGGDVEYITSLTSDGMPDATERGFLLYDEGEVQAYDYEASTTLWARKRADGTDFPVTLIIAAR